MIIYALSGLHCEKCVARLTNALQDKLQSFSITLQPPRLTINGAAPALVVLNQHLAAAGDYSAHELPDAPPTAAAAESSVLETYRPLILIAAYLVTLSLLLGNTAADAMRIFMAGFFLVFSFFKYMNLGGFAMTYARYNLLAARLPAYGYVYPFIELALGLSYALNYAPMATNWATLILSLFAGLGVLNALRQKKVLRCACLGTTLSLPVGWVTVVEDFGMAAMAAIMLFGFHA